MPILLTFALSESYSYSKREKSVNKTRRERETSRVFVSLKVRKL